MDPNKFSDNFLSLLDDFQAKKPKNQTGNLNRDSKNQDGGLSNEHKGGEFSGGDGQGDSKEDERNIRDELGKKNCNRRFSKNPIKKDDLNRANDISAGLCNVDSEIKYKRNHSKKGWGTERKKPSESDPTPKLQGENFSEHFFSVIDNFDNKLSLNKGTIPGKKKGDVAIKSEDEIEKPINGFNSNSNKTEKRNNTGNEGRKHFRDFRRNNDVQVRGESSKSNALSNQNNNESGQERANLKREPEISSKKSFKMMGYKFLESLLDSEISFVVTTLASPRSGFQELVDSRPIRPDLLMLIIKVLNKINKSEIHQLKVQILSNTFKPEFIDEIKKFVSRVCIEDNRKRLFAMNLFFENILNVLDTVVNSLPSTMNENLKSTLNALNLSMKSLRDDYKIVISEQLFEQLKELTDQVSSYIEHKNKIDKEQKHVSKKYIPPPNSYRDIPLVPTKEDFMTDGGYLRQNIVKGSYVDVDHYLDVQFRLLREDFIAPLREGLYEYIESLTTPRLKRRYTNVRIYHKVKFENPFRSRDVFGFYIQFDCDKKLSRHINWEYNKRFMPGSLLIFSDDNFQTFYLATVVDRKVEDLSKGLLFVTFVPGTDVPEYLFEPGVFFVMAESEVYYEAYKHVLSALQRMNEKNFPMKQYIVDVDTACFPPAYLMDNSVYKIGTFNVNLLEENSWPNPDQLKLNPSQHLALKSALTNDFVVIQGPPGTGKTFLALKITEILLKNDVSHNTPIVVICYTNHALDQFLEGILKYTKNLIRIGMQSQNEALKKYNIEEIRKKIDPFSRNANISALFRSTRDEKFSVQSKLQMVEQKIEELISPKGILNLNVLRSVITPQQFNELAMDPNMVLDWLFCFDDPEFHMVEKRVEEVVETLREVPVAPNEGKKVTENAPDIPEEDFEELDEEETARRLADMTEDDFFEEDFFTENDYEQHLNYSLSLEDIQMTIDNIKEEMNHQHIEDENTAYYFKSECIDKIRELNWQKHFLNEQFYRFSSFKFSPERFQMFQNVPSVWEISGNDRWEYYATWVHLYTCQLKQIVQQLTKIYQDVLMKLHELRQLEDVAFVQKASVVGLTTSGAAKRRVLLENLGTKIVIVEEAAEVLEAHIVTSLAPTVQHVILIGDHKQLKPNPAVFKLAKKYNMDCSLFERMLNNGLGCSVLNEQHRMRPEIASLIAPVIYLNLANHPSTLDRPKIRGIDRFVFFLTHDHPEDQLPDSSSKQNTHEADLLMELCKYLLLNEYRPDEITILATYTGQVWYMKKKRREMGLSYPDIRAVRITQVDNFQGEENRIILLSLVRSNKENKIGFLSTENRVCVALSRAKEGLYVIGNMDNLTNSSTIWPRIKQQLEAINAIGPRLTLRCERHSDQLTLIAKRADFQAVQDGGCSQMCGALLDCGHTCQRICHIIDQVHALYKCQEKCNRRVCTRVQEHKTLCPLRCWEACKPCNIRMEKTLPCGHTAHLRCHADPVELKCIVEVVVRHPACGHEIKKPCFRDMEDYDCTKPCFLRLPCGHACRKICHVDTDPDHLEYKCNKRCAREYKGCPRQEHHCPRPCYEECKPCQVPVRTTLPCGHEEEIPCSGDPETFLCQWDCNKTMNCGHECKLACGETCDPSFCTEKVQKLALCGHLMKLKCNEDPKVRKCHEPCSRLLPCGHPCQQKCFMDCLVTQCKEEVYSCISPACGHPAVKIPCYLNKPELPSGSDELVQLCSHPCGKQMDCGHLCAGTCGTCMQGRLHVACNQRCTRILVCGHRCEARCSMFCPPCHKRCVIKCSHQKCYGKTRTNHPCFRLCDSPCDKPCMWKCQHYQCSRRCGEECDRPPCHKPCQEMLGCGHPCIGYCGEVCPPLCAICNVGDPLIRSNPSARYVLLEDCKHVIEGSVLEAQISEATKNNIFRLMRCPYQKCSEPIVNTERCKTKYFQFRKQVVKINNLVDMDEIDRLRKMNARNSVLFETRLIFSAPMNSLMDLCSEPLKYQEKPQEGYEMGRLVVGCVLYPLLAICNLIAMDECWPKLICEEAEQRLWKRLDYFAQILLPRLHQIGYQEILQIELIVAQIIRLVSNKTTSLSWFNISPYTWEADRALVADNQLTPVVGLALPPDVVLKFSSTLRTRDSLKQWFLCNNQHLYVSENGETCVTCKEEAEGYQPRIEERRQQRLNERQRVRNIRPYGSGLRGSQGLTCDISERFLVKERRFRYPQGNRGRSSQRGLGKRPLWEQGRSSHWGSDRRLQWNRDRSLQWRPQSERARR